MADDSTPSWLRIFMNDSPGHPDPKKAGVFRDQSDGDQNDWFSRLFLNQPPADGHGSTPSCLKPKRGAVFWGMHDISVKAAGRHMLIIGAPGSGKTVSIELFLQSLVHRLRSPEKDVTPEKLVLLDVKGTFYSFLRAQGVPEEDIYILDPFDERTTPWDIAKDITGDAAAQNLAALIIPSEPNASTSYFWQAAQRTVWATIIALNGIRPGAWTLRDLINALSTPENIQRTVARVPRARIKADPYLKDTIHFPSVFTTIATKASRLETVAALWHQTKSKQRFSIADWFSTDESKQRHGVLLLGHRPKYLESLNPINGLLLRMISDELQAWADVSQPHTWIVLDEFRWMKEVDCMAELLGVGRSKGASILLGIQDVSGMRAAYGPDRTDEILGLCENKTFLRVGNAATAEWASKYFGDREATETKISHTYGKENSVTHAKDVVTRPLFLNGEFLNLEAPENRPGSRIQGIHHVPDVGDPYSTDEDAQVVYAMNRKPSKEHIAKFPNQKNRPMGDQSLHPWTPSEEESILGPLPEQPKEQPEPADRKPRAKRGRPKQDAADGAGDSAPPEPKGNPPADSDPTDQAPPYKKTQSTFGDFMRRTLDP